MILKKITERAKALSIHNYNGLLSSPVSGLEELPSSLVSSSSASSDTTCSNFIQSMDVAYIERVATELSLFLVVSGIKVTFTFLIFEVVTSSAVSAP